MGLFCVVVFAFLNDDSVVACLVIGMFGMGYEMSDGELVERR
jgi:hypothetical protein